MSCQKAAPFLPIAAPNVNGQQVLRSASEALRAKYNFYEMTLQIEDYSEDMSDCKQCVNPK